MINWVYLINALIVLESSGNNEAVNGNAVGCLQITPVFVEQANLVLYNKKKVRHKPTTNVSSIFRLHDRYDREMSIRMATLVLMDYEVRYIAQTGSCTAEDLAGMFRKGYRGYLNDPTTSYAYKKEFSKMYKR